MSGDTAASAIPDLHAIRPGLEAWLAQQPATRGARMTGLAVPEGVGWSNDTWLVDLELPGAAATVLRVVVRVQPEGWCLLPNPDVIGRQAILMEQVGRACPQIPVPEVLAIDREGQAVGRPLFVMRHVEGRPLADQPPYTTAGWFADEPPPMRERYLLAGFDAMCAVMQVPVSTAGVCELGPATGTPGLESVLADHARWIDWAGAGGLEEVATVWEWLQEHRPAAPPNPVALCWGDARPANQLFHAGGCTAVLDWEMSTLADPVKDLGWWLWWARAFTEGMGIVAPDGFPARDALILRWERATGCTARDADYYEVLAGLGAMLVVYRLMGHLADLGIVADGATQARDNPATRTTLALVQR